MGDHARPGGPPAPSCPGEDMQTLAQPVHRPRRSRQQQGWKPKVPGFEVQRLIGQGAGSLIYRARDLKSGKVVAIKHVSEQALAGRPARQNFAGARNGSWSSECRSYYDQLRTEYRVCRRLARTPLAGHLPEVYRLRARRGPWLNLLGYDLLLEYVPGMTLKEDREFPLAVLLRFYYQSARILYALHGMGLLHADLKPQHLIVTPAGRLKLLDFGQCRCPRDGQARRQGTPDYMAPEQLSGRQVDERTDVYGLGATFYWVLTGRSNRPALSVPGSMDFAISFSDRAQSLREDHPEIPPALERLVLDSCQPRAADRPGSMREVLERLEPLLS